jgi:cysteinyl-tRNA synthetase
MWATFRVMLTKAKTKSPKKQNWRNWNPWKWPSSTPTPTIGTWQLLNTWKPSIEPRATGHIPEQIALVEAILQEGLAYEVNGSVYFDVLKYNESVPIWKAIGTDPRRAN